MRLGAVGDVIRTLPLLHALRQSHPGSRIAWVVEEPSADLLREIPGLDAVHVLPRRKLAASMRKPWRWPSAALALRSTFASLRRERADVVLDAHGTLKAALVAAGAGSSVVGLLPPGSKEGAHLLHDVSLPFPVRPMSRVARVLHLGAAAGLIPATREADARFGLDFPAARTASIAELASRDGRPLVVLVPFASAKGQAKRWPLASHVELGRLLAARGMRPMLAWGSPREGEEARSAAAAAGGAVEVAPATDLVELSELLRRSALVVTGDTGPMHLAAAVGARVLALFGPSDPVINRPWGAGHEVLVASRLEDLRPEDVLIVAERLLAGR